MTIQAILIVVIVGIAAGILSGMVGVGGGLIIVPCLIYFLGFSQYAAQGTSLGVLLLPMGVLGVLEYYKKGYVDFKVVIILSLGFLIGSFWGSKISLSMSVQTVKKIFAVLMLIVALKILFIDSRKPSNPNEVENKK